MAFVFQYHVVDNRDQKVKTKVHDGVYPNQLVDAAFPSGVRQKSYHAMIHAFKCIRKRESASAHIYNSTKNRPRGYSKIKR